MLNNKYFVLTFIAAVFIIGGLLYIYNPQPIEYKNPNETEPIVCTADAKLCPDGSYVGRVPPNCDFEECKNIPKDAVFEDGTITNGSTTKEEVFCTMEVKACPDGSYVGRTPPNCEFKPCPTQ